MEKLIIKNFGPIKSATIQVAKFTLLIGYTASGKSTVAKLLCIFNSKEFYCLSSSSDILDFIRLLEDYSINYGIDEHTRIEYSNDYYKWVISAKGIDTDYIYGADFFKLLNFKVPSSQYVAFIKELASRDQKVAELVDESEILEYEKSHQVFEADLMKSWKRFIEHLKILLYKGTDATYIPAERNLFTIIKNNLFKLADNGFSIPKSLAAFGAKYEWAKATRDPLFKIPFLKAQIHFMEKGEEDMLLIKGKGIPLSSASSGYQSLIPLYTVMDDFFIMNARFFEPARTPLLVIEEPELNLFPSVQKELIQEIVRGINGTNCSTVIASHSPYVLSVVDTLVQAGNVAKDPKKREKIKEVFEEKYWIDFDDVECYYFSKQGVARSVKNKRLKIIGANILDEISEDLNSKYDQLLDIKYNE